MISKRTAEHYLCGEGCEGWHLVNTPGLSVIQERMPGGTSEQRHRHASSRQFFFILTGTAVMEIGDRNIALSALQGVEIPPGVHHRIRNDSGYAIEFIVVSAPHSHGDRIVSESSGGPDVL